MSDELFVWLCVMAPCFALIVVAVVVSIRRHRHEKRPVFRVGDRVSGTAQYLDGEIVGIDISRVSGNTWLRVRLDSDVVGILVENAEPYEPVFTEVKETKGR
jgi:hypothetical protein